MHLPKKTLRRLPTVAAIALALCAASSSRASAQARDATAQAQAPDAFSVDGSIAGSYHPDTRRGLFVVGSPASNTVVTHPAGYLFWRQGSRIQSTVNEGFGKAVDIRTELRSTAGPAILVAVGAPDHDGPNLTNSGRVHIYIVDRYDASRVLHHHTVTATTPRSGQFFGSSVALSMRGDVPMLAVGEPRAGSSGRAHVYLWSASQSRWVHEQTFTPFGQIFRGDQFGYSIDLDGNDLAVGSPYNDLSGDESGCVHTYRFENGIWNDGSQWGGALAGAWTGTSVAVGSGHLAVGSPNARGGRGRVDVFDLNVSATQQVSASFGENPGELLGTSIDMATNGSTFVQVLIGKPGADGSGALETLQTGRNGWASVSHWQDRTLGSSPVRFGQRVAIGGPKTEPDNSFYAATAPLQGRGLVTSYAGFRSLTSIRSYGRGLADSNGSVPSLSVRGQLAAEHRLRFDIRSNRADLDGLLLLGTRTADIPVLGGRLLVTPLITLPVRSNAYSSARWDFLPGIGEQFNNYVFAQAVFLSSHAAQGITMSNGVSVAPARL